MRGDSADEEFAIAGGGNGARFIVRVSAGADDRAVADAAGSLVRIAAGRSRGGEITRLVEGHRAHRAVAVRVRERFGSRGTHALQRLPALFRIKIFLVHDV